MVLADDGLDGVHGLFLGRVNLTQLVFLAHGFPFVLAKLMVGEQFDLLDSTVDVQLIVDEPAKRLGALDSYNFV